MCSGSLNRWLQWIRVLLGLAGSRGLDFSVTTEQEHEQISEHVNEKEEQNLCLASAAKARKENNGIESAAAIWGSLNVLLGGRGLNDIRDKSRSDTAPFIYNYCVSKLSSP
jgi:hypothetical protein